MAALDDEVIDAAEDGDIEEVSDWLSRGGDPNQRDHAGLCLLHYLLTFHRHDPRGDRSELIRLLVSHGADVNRSAFIDGNIGSTPLHVSVLPGETNLLIDLGADVDAVDEHCNNLTPLMHAVLDDDHVRSMARMRILLHRGADVNANATNDRDAEYFARRMNRDELADVLARVKAAGSWPRYVRAPRVALARLRLLCARGRARPPTARRDPILARLFAAPPPASSNKRLASRQVHRPLPNEIFWLVLSFWRTDRD